MDVNARKLKIAYQEVIKTYPYFLYEDADRYVEAVETEKYTNAQQRRLCSMQQVLTVVACKLKLSAKELKPFKLLIGLYYKPEENNVIRHEFRQKGLRSKSRL